MPDTLETASHDLNEARAKIEATRAELVAVLDAQETPDNELTALVTRLNGMTAKLAPIEAGVAETQKQGELPKLHNSPLFGRS